jgi:hypothetical protein
LASEKGHVEIVRLLFAKLEESPRLYERIDPAARDNYPIKAASDNGRVEVIKLLLAKKEEKPDLYEAINPAAEDNDLTGLFMAC